MRPNNIRGGVGVSGGVGGGGGGEFFVAGPLHL